MISMGKKKQQKQPTVKHIKEERGKKTYSLSAASGQTKVTDNKEYGPKIKVPLDLEQEIIDLIQEENKHKTTCKELSGRVTSKKLTDMYTCLSQAGFSHSQIEQCMNNTVLYGGDLIDALDWFCLNLANDQLPDGFSAALENEENKIRPKFDVNLHKKQESVMDLAAAAAAISEKPETHKPATKSKSPEMKDWILQYAGRDSDDSDDDYEDDDDDSDPNDQYLVLTAKLLDAREGASQAKTEGNKKKQKEFSQLIRDIVLKMDAIEQNPSFNPEMKIKDLDVAKENSGASAPQNKTHDGISGIEKKKSDVAMETEAEQNHSDDNEGLGFGLFEQEMAEDVAPKKEVKAKPKEKLEKRSFEYTRQQWTAKSPKQFLIDWCRKHKSADPKYEKIQVGGNLWRCRVKINRKKEGKIDVVPDIVCENVKEAEHLGSTLALYQLCKGQSVHQLLPPPYRAVWLEWQDQEKKVASKAQTTENKARDQYITKLIKKLQGTTISTSKSGNHGDDDTADSWEDLDNQNDQDFAVSETKPSSSTTQRRHYHSLDSSALRKLLQDNQQQDLYKTLLKSRQTLPVFEHQDYILNHISGNSVVVIAGETGSGKSTQIPQFVLQHHIEKGLGNKCNIVCTQPRRISAVSLASRVSQEMGEASLGSHKSVCGYQIRFESRRGPNTKLTYCTTGVLLRQLQSDPMLKDVSHVIVDEVHERSVQSDFLMIILRKLLRRRADLKVILMSATLDSEKFSAYFQHCPVINIPGRTFPVEVYHLEDIVQKTGFVLDEDSQYALRPEQFLQEEKTNVAVTGRGGEQTRTELSWTKGNISRIDTTNLSPEKYVLRTRNTVSRLNPDMINMEIIVELLLYLQKDAEFKEVDGAVLIFLPGLADIQELNEILSTDRNFNNPDRYQILALHSVLSSSDQSAAFVKPRAGVRKIVIATNIAETGITIPDVVFVIDAGKAKENRYMESSQMSVLKEVFISKASAKQRQGRAGRVREGFCFRLYTSEKFASLAAYTTPEIQRVPLEELCLHIMECKMGEPEEFLSEALDPPRSQVVARAMSMLYEVGACKGGSTLTPLGHHLAALPVNVRIGKMLLFGAIFGYLEPVAIIAAAMTTKSPFVAPMHKLDLAQSAKLAMATACSDHITVYRAYAGWKLMQKEGKSKEHQFCQKYFLNRKTLLEVEDLKYDLIKLVNSIGFSESLKRTGPQSSDSLHVKSSGTEIPDVDGKMVAMVKAVITAGFYPNVAKTTSNGPANAEATSSKNVCIGETAQGPAHVHPSSVNRNLAVTGWLAYQEKVTTSRVYLRECSLVSPFSLLLFGGDILVEHMTQCVSVDQRIKFMSYARTGVIFKELRKLLDTLLERKLSNPGMAVTDDPVIQVIFKLLQTEGTRSR